MRWEDRGVSDNIEDRRGERPGGGFGFPGGGARVGCGTLALLLVLSVVFKQDFFQFLNTMPAGGSGAGATQQAPPGEGETTPEEEKLVRFISFVLDDTQATWTRILPQFGGQYRDAKLVLFRDATQAACGFAQAASGPFYCPVDEKVYIDLGFYDELRTRFGAAGDFAQAYVLAHEIGHHLQKVVGTEQQMRRAQQARPDMANQLSVRLELQADCYAGVWAHSSQAKLLPGDIEEGMNAAASVGDDRIQRQSQGYVNPDGFTHGSSEQRQAWFRRGLDKGDLRACDTFSAR
jgi:uncharacterized protein